ncbi:hypothetical protein MHYP_G00043360 [Metynnis hypsauchen]
MSEYLKRVMKDTCPSSSESETTETGHAGLFQKQREDNAVRMSLPMKCLQDKDPDDENVWMSGLAEKYMARLNTPEFESMCMAEFASEYGIQ